MSRNVAMSVGLAPNPARRSRWSICGLSWDIAIPPVGGRLSSWSRERTPATSERDRHDPVGERDGELAECRPGRTAQHLAVAAVTRPMALTDVGGAVCSGDRARLVAADRVNRGE